MHHENYWNESEEEPAMGRRPQSCSSTSRLGFSGSGEQPSFSSDLFFCGPSQQQRPPLISRGISFIRFSLDRPRSPGSKTWELMSSNILLSTSFSSFSRWRAQAASMTAVSALLTDISFSSIWVWFESSYERLMTTSSQLRLFILFSLHDPSPPEIVTGGGQGHGLKKIKGQSKTVTLWSQKSLSSDFLLELCKTCYVGH